MGRRRSRFKIWGKTTVYAVRDKRGRFKDIQLYRRAHRLDMKRKARGERRHKRR